MSLEDKGLKLRLDAAERDAMAWKETALNAQKDHSVALGTITRLRYERNLLRRERKALSLAIREVVEQGGNVADFLDLMAALANPLRPGEGLLLDEEDPDDGD